MARLLAAALALLVIAACGEEASTAVAAPVVELRIRVDNGEGRSASATLTCRDGRRRVTGFLRGRARGLCGFARRESAFLGSPPPRDRACTEVFGGPDTARVRGRIGRRTIDRRFSRSDGCEISDWERAGPLFRGAPRSSMLG